MNEHLQDLRAGGRSMKKWEIEMQQKDKEIERLKQRLDDIDYFVKQRCEEEITDNEKAILQSIALISNGTIKVVRDD